MSDTRKVADQLTDAVIKEDLDAGTSGPRRDAMLIAPGGVYKGRQQIAEFFQTWFDPLSELSDEGRGHDDGEQPGPRRVVIELHQHRVARADGETVPAPGKRVTVRDANICTVEGDLAVEQHIYCDQVEMLRQLGLLSE